VHNFEGELVLGSMFNGAGKEQLSLLNDLLKDSFDVHIYPDIRGAKYLKIFLNLNNCIPACLGRSMQEVYSDVDICEVAIRNIREAYKVVKASGIELQSLPSFKKEKILGFVDMDFNEASFLFSRIMTGLSKEPLYGSVLQSILRKRPTEIDYINAQIVELAEENNMDALLNEKLTEMVHVVEGTGKFFTKEDFLEQVSF